MKTAVQAAPAKVNLALDILGCREDGYHDMRMVMQSISLCDIVRIRETESGFRLLVDENQFEGGETSMEQRTAEVFFNYLHRPLPGLEVRLEKQIPAYAGMGGGSSDVAAFLRGLRQMYAPDLPDRVLEEIGLSIGSDVPFCIRGGAALAEGRGERLTPLPSLAACWLVLCKPPFGLPTPEMFRRIRVDCLRNRPDVAAVERGMRQRDPQAVAAAAGNVFEEVLTQEERREIQAIRDTMIRYGAWNAAMTGSGPIVFGIFPDSAAAAGGAEWLKTRYAEVFCVQPLPTAVQQV